MREYLFQAAQYAAKQPAQIKMLVRIEGIELVRSGFYHRLVLFEAIELAKVNPLILAIDQLMAMGQLSKTTDGET